MEFTSLMEAKLVSSENRPKKLLVDARDDFGVILQAAAQQVCEELDAVNVFIGTGGLAFGYGSINPAAQLPFSPLRLGPDTTDTSVDLSYRHFSGYNFNDRIVRGFSHTHLVGAGVNDLGNFGFMPTVIEADANISLLSTVDGKPFWWAAMSKDSESGEPGRYSIQLRNPSVDVDLLAIGTFAGIHRYQWHRDPLMIREQKKHQTVPGLVIDICHAAKLEMPDKGICQNASVSLSLPSATTKAAGSTTTTVDKEDGNTLIQFRGSVYFSGSLSRGIWVHVYGEVVGSSVISAVQDWQTCTSTAVNSSSSSSNSSSSDESPDCSDAMQTSSSTGILYSVLRFSTTPTSSSEESESSRSASETAPAAAAGLQHQQGLAGVQVRVGISFISADVAALNLADALRETSDFRALALRTRSIWCSHLNEMQVVPVDQKGGDASSSSSSSSPLSSSSLATVLHSAHYRTLMSPTSYTESGGLYVGLDGEIHNVAEERLAFESTEDAAADFADARRGSQGEEANSNSNGFVDSMTFFSDFSLWDTYRTQHPWLLLRNEPLALGLVRSLAEMTGQQNAFPRWPIASHESSCMIGEHGAAAVLEAVYAGLGELFDLPLVQSTLLVQSTQSVPLNGRTDVEHYLEEGFVSQESSDDATSKTLTYAFDDYLLAQLSRIVGDDAAAKSAMERSGNYRNVWSDRHQLFCPRYSSSSSNGGGSDGDGSDGVAKMVCPRTGASPWAWTVYREGDAFHWSWFVPHDPQGLIGLYPSAQAFVESLESFLQNHVEHQEKFGSAVPNPYYWAGNEHDLHAPWLFNYVNIIDSSSSSNSSSMSSTRSSSSKRSSSGGACTRTQYWTRKLVPMHFSNSPHGIPGNDDYAAMSAWVIFASLGLFPQAGTSHFLIGSPSVAEASIKLWHVLTPREQQQQQEEEEEEESTKDGRNSSRTRLSSMLTIVAHNNTEKNVFVEKLLINGREHNSPLVDRSLLSRRHGEDTRLEFFMSSTESSALCPI